MNAENYSGLNPFIPGDTSTVSARWKKWKRSFTIFLDVNNITIPARKKSYLLHFVGSQVQDVFFSLQGEEAPAVPAGSDEYKEAVKLLDDYFLPMKCLPLERHKFRNIEQADDEPIERFVLRLREQGNLCEYGEHLDEEIKEQLFEKGASDGLREKILNKPTMTLAETIEAGRSLETIGKHRQSSRLIPQQEALNRIAQTANSSKNAKMECRRCGRSGRTSDNCSGWRECYRCGRSGHFANDDNCPALDRKCLRCGLVGHFKKRCKTKQKEKKVTGKQQQHVTNDSDSNGSDNSDSSSSEEESVLYLFGKEQVDEEKVICMIGGVLSDWVVDSGTNVNVVDCSSWERLKKEKVRVNFQTVAAKKSLKSYTGDPVAVIGMFSAEVRTKENEVTTDFYVVQGGNCSLLGRDTAKALGILNINTAGSFETKIRSVRTWVTERPKLQASKR